MNGCNPSTATCGTAVSVFKMNKAQLNFRCVSHEVLPNLIESQMEITTSVQIPHNRREWDKATVEQVQVRAMGIPADNKLVQRIRDRKKFTQQKKKIVDGMLSPNSSKIDDAAPSRGWSVQQK